MISSVEAKIKSWKTNQWLDFNQELQNVAFDIICNILFGMDINEKIDKFTYTNSNDIQSQLELKEFFIEVVKDIMKSLMNPLSILFPFIVDYNLCKPYTTIEKNCAELRAVLKKFLDMSSDESSVYKQLIHQHKVDETQALHDIIMLLFAGYDTTSHAICSVIYFMKVNPEACKKLKSELSKIGINQHTDYSNAETKEKIQNCDYLLYVIKETLRMDPPAYSSVPTKTKDSIEV